MFVCAGKNEQFDFAEPMGIGLVDTAIGLTKLCIEKKPDKIIFAGTAGSYGKADIFDIVESAVATNIENSSLEHRSYTPIDNVVEAVAYGGAKSTTPTVSSLQTISSYRLLDSSHVSRETIVNSSNYITTDIKLAKGYIQKGIDLENMEFFAVLRVAEMFSIPAFGIFVVTNYCDERAHEDFVSNRAKAMKKLTTYIKERYV